MPTPQITLTGTLVDVFGNPDIGASVVIQLCNLNGVAPRIPGAMALAAGGAKVATNGAGFFSTPLWGNDVITPPGTYYAISVLGGNGQTVQASNYLLTGSGTFDLSNLVPYGGGSTSQPVPAGAPATATLVVTNAVIGAVPATFAGLSYEKSTIYESTFKASDLSLIGVFRTLGTLHLRLGGGTADTTIWKPSGPGTQANFVAPPDVAALAAFVAAVPGLLCLYAINLAEAGGSQTTALAAEEIAAAHTALGAAWAGCAIGNEVDYYGTSGHPAPPATPWTPANYLALWETYRAAIVATTPLALATGPELDHTTSWLAALAGLGSAAVALLTAHWYTDFAANPTATAAELLNPASAPNVALVNTYLPAIKAASVANGMPFRLDETNDFADPYGSGNTVVGSYADALWALDHMLRCAVGGAAGVNFHQYVIETNAGAVTGLLPLYYGIKLWTMAGAGNLWTTALAAGGLNATAIAIAKTGGGLSLIVSNKQPTTPLALEITVPATIAAASLVELTQGAGEFPDITASGGVTIQGSGVTNAGTFAPAAAYTLTPAANQLTCYVPALSAVLISIA